MMSYFLGIISGIIISVIGQIFGIIFVRPVHDLNEARGKLNSTLIYRYNVFANPGTTIEQMQIDTSEELRTHASLLLAKAKRVYWYNYFSYSKLIPPRNNIYKAHSLLVSISNNITREYKKENREDCKKIAELLKLEVKVGAMTQN